MADGKPGPASRIREKTPDGTPIADAIISRIRAGAYFENACMSVGISRHVAYQWRSKGANLRRQIADGEMRRKQLTPDQKRYMAFSEGIDQAEAEWEVKANAQLEAVARGGHVVRTRTRTVRVLPTGGEEVTESEKEEVMPPNPAVIQWRLERRFPDRYGKRTRVDVGGQPDNPVAVHVSPEALLEKLQALKDDE